MVVAKSPERLSGVVAEAASMSRPRDLSHASSAPRCTSAAGNVAVAVVVANGGTSCGTSWGFLPRSRPPELAGLASPTRSALSCSSVPRAGGAQRDSYTTFLATPELRRHGRLAAGRRDSGKMAVSEGKLSRPNWVKSFLGAGITTRGQLHPLAH